MYINTETNQYPISESDIREENSNTSFPFPFEPPPKYQWVFPSPQPTYNQVTQIAIETHPELTDSGHREQRWKVISRFTEYTDESGKIHTVAEQEAAAIAIAEKTRLEMMQREIVRRTQERLDTFALTRNYSGILSATTYADSAITKFATEGAYAKQARDATWAKLYEILAEVQAGTRSAPTSFEQIEPELPPLQWPN